MPTVSGMNYLHCCRFESLFSTLCIFHCASSSPLLFKDAIQYMLLVSQDKTWIPLLFQQRHDCREACLIQGRELVRPCDFCQSAVSIAYVAIFAASPSVPVYTGTEPWPRMLWSVRGGCARKKERDPDTVPQWPHALPFDRACSSTGPVPTCLEFEFAHLCGYINHYRHRPLRICRHWLKNHQISTEDIAT